MEVYKMKIVKVQIAYSYPKYVTYCYKELSENQFNLLSNSLFYAINKNLIDDYLMFVYDSSKEVI